MSFSANLFHLLDTADITIIDGYEIDGVSGCLGVPRRFCECADDFYWEFEDQRVEVDDDGYCDATQVEEGEAGDVYTRVQIRFLVKRPITKGDLE